MRKEDVLRKRNEELSKQLEEAKIELSMQKDLNSEAAQKAKELITRLEIIKSQMEQTLDEIENIRNKYKSLITEMKEFKDSVKGRNAIERWFYDRRK